MSQHTASRTSTTVTFAWLALASASYSLLQSLVVPALPEMQHALHTNESGASWIFTAYLLSASIATPLVGRLGDLHGKKRTLVAVMVLLSLGTAISAASTSLALMIVGRLLQGVAGGLFPLAFGIIRDEFPPERTAGSIGVLSALLGVGGGLGIVLSGPIVEHLSFHWIFWLALIPSVVATVGIAAMVPESPLRAKGSIGWLAGILLSVGLGALLLAISQAPAWGWLGARTLVLAIAAIAVLVVWVRVELRSAEPLVDMRVMRLRGVWTTNLVAALLGFGMYTGMIIVPQYVELAAPVGFGSSVTEAGLFMVPMTVLMLTTSVCTGWIERRFGSRLPLLAGTAATGVGFLMLALARSSQLEIYVATAIVGLGIGLAFASLMNLVIEAVPREQTGIATGVNTIARTIGGAFGTEIVASLLTASASGHGGPTDGGFTLSFALIAIALAIGVIACLGIPRRPQAHAQGVALEPAAA